jgi:hypothetical protein
MEVNGVALSIPRMFAPDLVTVVPGRLALRIDTWTMPGPTHGSTCLYLEARSGDQFELASSNTKGGFQVTVHRVAEGKRTLIATELIPYRSAISGRCDTRPQTSA